MLKINGSFGTDKVTVLLSQSYYFCEKVTVVMKITVCLGRKLPSCSKVTVYTETYRYIKKLPFFSRKLLFLNKVTVIGKSYRFWIKLPLLEKVTVIGKSYRFWIKLPFFIEITFLWSKSFFLDGRWQWCWWHRYDDLQNKDVGVILLHVGDMPIGHQHYHI